MLYDSIKLQCSQDEVRILLELCVLLTVDTLLNFIKSQNFLLSILRRS